MRIKGCFLGTVAYSTTAATRPRGLDACRGYQGFLNTYFPDFAAAPMFDPESAQASLGGSPESLWRLPTVCVLLLQMVTIDLLPCPRRHLASQCLVSRHLKACKMKSLNDVGHRYACTAPHLLITWPIALHHSFC